MCGGRNQQARDEVSGRASTSEDHHDENDDDDDDDEDEEKGSSGIAVESMQAGKSAVSHGAPLTTLCSSPEEAAWCKALAPVWAALSPETPAALDSRAAAMLLLLLLMNLLLSLSVGLVAAAD